MRMRFFLSLFASALLFTGCDIIFITPDYNSTARRFWALDTGNNSFYSLRAQKLAEGEYCTVWGEIGNNRATFAAAERMVTAYDTDIYPKMKAVFSIDNLKYERYEFKDTMDFADALGDNDDKLCILLLDIKDGYKPNTGGTYVAGYFWAGNFFPNGSPYLLDYMRSNECDMIYVDTNPSEPGNAESNKTLAHEMQHMMNFVNSQVLRESPMDLWLDEGLSSAAEWVFAGAPDTYRLTWYNNISTTIITGNNFFVWDQYEDESVLDDYATVNLFFQWLRLQSGGSTNIYKAISGSSRYDYSAVVGAMNGYSDWGTLLKTWHAANYINAPRGPYGYMDDSVLKHVKARTVPSGTKSVNLYPGEGVYSLTDSAGNTPDPGRNIRYAGLNSNSGAVNDATVFASGTLLTYNIDTNSEGQLEAGMTTGIAASVTAIPESLFVGAMPSGLFKISAGDMLRHNGYEAYTPPFLRFDPGYKDR